MKKIITHISCSMFALFSFSFSGIVECQAEPEPLDYVLNMVHHNPGEPLFITKYIEPEYLSEIGYNGDCPRLYIQTSITYNDFEPGLISYDSDTWAWIQRYAKNMDHFIRQHKKENLPIYPFTDVLVIPKEIMDKYGDEMKVDGKLSIQRDKTQEVLKAQIAEIFKRFDIDGLMVRFGETYLSDTPFHVGGKPVHSREDHVLLINILREEICVKLNKKLFYRTWDFGNNFHINPDYYGEVTGQVAPHTNLIFSVKHSGGDFLRDAGLNSTLGVGSHKQIVEVSLMQAGVYGKGAYPYYIGHGVLHGWSEMDTPKGISDLVGNGTCSGVFIWPRGDSWSGPYLSSEFWVDLNEYVIREFAKRPHLTDQVLFEEYCQLKLGLDALNTARLYELCMLSAEATYDGKHSRYFRVTPWTQRDDKIKDVADLPSPESVSYELLIAEKAGAVADWKKIETLSQQIVLNNPDDQEYLEVSSTYGRIYFEILEQLWKLRIYHETNQANVDLQPITDLIEHYDALWNEWFILEQEHPSCATLFMTAWPQTWPPTWRESRSENFAYHHDTPLVSLYRDWQSEVVLESALVNPSFELNGLNGADDFESAVPQGWVGNSVGTIGVIGELRQDVSYTPYGSAWLHLQGKGSAVGQVLGDMSLIGEDVAISYIVTRRSNEDNATDHYVRLVAGTASSFSGGVVLSETEYVTPLSASGQFMEVAFTATPTGDPGNNDTLWLVLESNLEGEAQLHFDGISAGVSSNTLPVAPEGLEATSRDAAVDLTWNPVSSAENYNITRSLSSGGPYAQIFWTNTTTYIDAGLINGQAYYYVVSASNTVGDGPASVEISAVPSVAIQVDESYIADAVVVEENLFSLCVLNSVTGHVYEVLATGSLVNPEWLSVITKGGTGADLHFSMPINSSNQYFKIDVQRM